MATNEILQFAETDTGTNLLTQAEYLADSQRPIGNQPGVARSKLVNKALRQASLISAGLAEYIADNQANNISDALTPQNIADYLQSAITGALGVTPPQFDNDTSLATTAFVQRALGSMSGYAGLTNGQALTSAAIGKLHNISSGVASVTLPDLAGLPTGASVSFINTSNADCTISRAGTNTLATNDIVVNSCVVKNGDSITFVKATASLWFAIGTAALQGSASFGSSLGSSGYQKLPGGFIVQWGRATHPGSGSGGVNFSFPITFPVACSSFTAIELGATPTVGFAFQIPSASQFTLYTNNATSVIASWIAIGR